MSNVSQEILQQLVQVLSNLVSNDNAVRSAAEEQLNNEWMVKSPDALLSGFAYLSRNSDEADVSLFCMSISQPLSLFRQIPKTLLIPLFAFLHVSVIDHGGDIHLLNRLVQQPGNSNRNANS